MDILERVQWKASKITGVEHMMYEGILSKLSFLFLRKKQVNGVHSASLQLPSERVDSRKGMGGSPLLEVFRQGPEQPALQWPFSEKDVQPHHLQKFLLT